MTESSLYSRAFFVSLCFDRWDEFDNVLYTSSNHSSLAQKRRDVGLRYRRTPSLVLSTMTYIYMWPWDTLRLVETASVWCPFPASSIS